MTLKGDTEGIRCGQFVNIRLEEKDLTEGFAPELRPKAHHWLILHGRYVCTARKPKCHECGLQDICREYIENNVRI